MPPLYNETSFDLQPDYMYEYTNTYSSVGLPISDIVVSSVLLYLGLCANIWMVWSLYKSWSTGSRFHFYFLSLCLTDMLYLGVALGTKIGVDATITWQGGNFGCKFVLSLRYFCTMLLCVLLACFNIDNFVTVIRSSSVKILRVIFLVASVFVSLAVSAPLLWAYYMETIGGFQTVTVCMLRYTGHFLYQMLEIPSFWIPMAIVLISGTISLIVWNLKKGTDRSDVVKVDESEEDMKSIGKTIGLITAYDILFILFCLPPQIFTLLLASVGYEIGVAWILALKIMAYMAPAKCVLDPILYAIHRRITSRQEKPSPGL